MSENDYKYKISVVVPVYNVEKYLEETIESVVNQSIGFENIQLILVNDGSPDNSEAICLKYKEKYPNNIIYVKKKNGGVSSARNEGINYIEGKYVNFLDSDDKQGLNAYKIAYNMMENDSSFDVCSVRMKYFDKSNKYHRLDFKFKNGDRVVDLVEEPNNPTFHITSAIIRSDVAKKFKFDTNIKLGEDFKYLAEVVVQKAKIGFISSETFYYRRRSDESSAIQTSKTKKDFYTITPKYVYEYLLKLGNKFKKAKKWIQYCIVSDLRYRLYSVDFSCLTSEEIEDYKKEIRKIYNMCEDYIIVNQYDLETSNKYRALEYKYSKPIYKNIIVNDNYLTLNGEKIFNLENLEIKISIFEIRNNNLNIMACFDLLLNNDYELYIKSNNKYYKFNKINIRENDNNLYSEDYNYYKSYFDINLNLNNITKFQFFLKINGNYHLIKPIYQNFSKLNELPHSYYSKSGFTLTHDDKSVYVNKKVYFKFIKYLNDILFIKKDYFTFKLLFFYKFTHNFVKHNNWIIYPNQEKIEDDMLNFLNYLSKSNNRRKIYFVLKKNHKLLNVNNFNENILYLNSKNYFIKYMNSEVIISSSTDNSIRKIYGRRFRYLNPFISNSFVNIKFDDLIENVSKYDKNVNLMFCSSKSEYDELISNKLYHEDEVVLIKKDNNFEKVYKEITKMLKSSN